MSMKIPGKLTDSTGGSVTETCDDTTANTKDDLASIISKIAQLVDVVIALDKRLIDLEGQ